MKISRRWWQMAEIYKRFAGDYKWNDFSQFAAMAMYKHESYGYPVDEHLPNGKLNGYLVGKKWMNLTITEYWIPDLIEGKTLFIWELYDDYPHWFIKKVLPKDLQRSIYF